MHNSIAQGGVLFDLDGTLVDSSQGFILAMQRTLDHFATPRLPGQIIKQNISSGARHIINLAKPGIPASDLEQWRDYFISVYNQDAVETAEFYPHIKTMLQSLNQQQIPWGIVTNKPKVLALATIEHLALSCPVLIAPEDVLQVKPSPEGILLACQQLNIEPPSSIYVGDHIKDIQAGQAANCKTIAVNWGFAGDDGLCETWQANVLVHDSRQLVTAILQLLNEQ